MTASPLGQGPGPHAESAPAPAAEPVSAPVSGAEPAPAAEPVSVSVSVSGAEPAPESGSAGEADQTDESTTDGATTAEPTEALTTPPPAADTDGEGLPSDGVDTTAAGGSDAAEPSEAAAALIAQRELRKRIEQRKAEKDGPIASGAKLSGQAADLLAAVRAVESGEKRSSAFYDAPAPSRAASAEPARAAATGPTRPPQSPQAPTESGAVRSSSPETLAAVRTVLGAGGAPEALAVQAADVLGDQAGAVLRADPWQLLSVPGVSPEQADGFARALLGAECGPGDDRRSAALVMWQLERAARQGHTAVDSASVCAALAERSVPEPEEALHRAAADGVVLIFDSHSTDGEEEPADDDSEEAPAAGPVLLGLDRYALAEESLADGLARLARSDADDRWAAVGSDELARAVVASGLVVHTGGEAARAEPVALAGAAAALGLRTVVAVHSEYTVQDEHGVRGAVTVPGLLSGAQGPGRDKDGALALDLLVVLDAPQLDVETAAMLVESLPDGSRLLLSGDPGQLGSAGAGRVFADLLAARVCPSVSSRTPDPGPIGELVSGIGAGELGVVDAPGKEVVIIPVRDAGEAVHRTVQLVADSVPRAIGVPTEQTQVITVGHGGSAGTRALNAALKQRLNPGPGRFGGFDPGDRVAYTPALGRTVPGTVVSADAEGLRLECGNTPVTVPKERVDTALRHGWAMTAHQAAGMRWPAAVVVLPGDAVPGLSRPWVYTAFGRAARHLSVVHGVDRALPHAVAQIPSQERTTRLRTLLEGLLLLPEPAPES
ncbi:helix-hairpin-helix domain-containing protein [Streptomyces albipurpureus]|uniref:AAA family ATPase n=1 Tax=Streptomyces albipurpureus TaxID=2897419 RepID=A0ABT0UPJ2_9ACTN|nr:helix-hairpin-helix domain-containing protein [Streptomyces sp. CWNU-1]MCM2390345.1 AAA family ATPase [Streptomyces sp. CWNU-1]